jgi:hypothetical protein
MRSTEPAFAEATAWQAEDEPNAERPISNEEKEMVAPFSGLRSLTARRDQKVRRNN